MVDSWLIASLGLKDRYDWILSAKQWASERWVWIMSNSLLVLSVKRRGPRQDTCGTPHSELSILESAPVNWIALGTAWQVRLQPWKHLALNTKGVLQWPRSAMYYVQQCRKQHLYQAGEARSHIAYPYYNWCLVSVTPGIFIFGHKPDISNWQALLALCTKINWFWFRMIITIINMPINIAAACVAWVHALHSSQLGNKGNRQQYIYLTKFRSEVITIPRKEMSKHEILKINFILLLYITCTL